MSNLENVLLLNTLIATGIGVLAWVAWKFRARPVFVHALYVLAMIKLVTPPVIELPLLPRESPEVVSRMGPVVEAEEPGEAVSVVLTPRRSVPRAQAAEPIDWRQWVMWAWLSCSLALFVIVARRLIFFHRELRRSGRECPRLQRQVGDLAQRLGLAKAPKVVVVPSVVSPLLWPLGKGSRLVLPERLLERLEAPQFEALVLHELAHLKRRDHWMRWVEGGITLIYFFHPLMWMLRRGLHDAEEACCDAWVTWAQPGREHAYARALVETVGFVGNQAQPSPLVATGFGYSRSLERRLTMILSAKTPRTMSHGIRWSVLALALVVLPAIPIAAGSVDPADSSEPAAGQNTVGTPDESAFTIAADQEELGTYTVRAGDSLVSISRRLYGTTNRWKEIAALNGWRKHGDPEASGGNEWVTFDPRRLRVGQKLKVPHQKKERKPSATKDSKKNFVELVIDPLLLEGLSGLKPGTVFDVVVGERKNRRVLVQGAVVRSHPHVRSDEGKRVRREMRIGISPDQVEGFLRELGDEPSGTKAQGKRWNERATWGLSPGPDDGQWVPCEEMGQDLGAGAWQRIRRWDEVPKDGQWEYRHRDEVPKDVRWEYRHGDEVDPKGAEWRLREKWNRIDDPKDQKWELRLWQRRSDENRGSVEWNSRQGESKSKPVWDQDPSLVEGAKSVSERSGSLGPSDR